jgi:hypothetical protein
VRRLDHVVVNRDHPVKPLSNRFHCQAPLTRPRRRSDGRFFADWNDDSEHLPVSRVRGSGLSLRQGLQIRD